MSSRPRYKSPNLENATIKGNHSHLHFLELLYLGLSVVSPLIGAILLRSVTSALNIGPSHDHRPLSWFSTSLFALIAGLKPWSHLVERLQGHTDGLHDAIGEAIAAENTIPNEVLEEKQNAEIEALHGSIELLEHDNEELNGSVNLLEERIWKLERGRERDRKRMEEFEAQMLYLTTLAAETERDRKKSRVDTPSFPTNPLRHPILYITAILSFLFHFLMTPIASLFPRAMTSTARKTKGKTVQFELRRLTPVPEESEEEEGDPEDGDIAKVHQGKSTNGKGSVELDLEEESTDADSIASDETAKPIVEGHPSHSFFHIVFVTPAMLVVKFLQGVLKFGF
jgi:hypothetical protein